MSPKNDQSQQSDLSQRSYGQYCPYKSSLLGAGSLPDHQNTFRRKAINAVQTNPCKAYTPNCLCSTAMNLKPEDCKHLFCDCPFATNNDFCRTAFISVCSLLVNLKRKVTTSGGPTASQATHKLAMNRLQPIIDSPNDHYEDADIESDDESSVASAPSDFQHGDNPFQKLLGQQ